MKNYAPFGFLCVMFVVFVYLCYDVKQHGEVPPSTYIHSVPNTDLGTVLRVRNGDFYQIGDTTWRWIDENSKDTIYGDITFKVDSFSSIKGSGLAIYNIHYEGWEYKSKTDKEWVTDGNSKKVTRTTWWAMIRVGHTWRMYDGPFTIEPYSNLYESKNLLGLSQQPPRT